MSETNRGSAEEPEFPTRRRASKKQAAYTDSIHLRTYARPKCKIRPDPARTAQAPPHVRPKAFCANKLRARVLRRRNTAAWPHRLPLARKTRTTFARAPNAPRQTRSGK